MSGTGHITGKGRGTGEPWRDFIENEMDFPPVDSAIVAEIHSSNGGDEERVIDERPIKTNAQIRDLGDGAYELLEPIFITIEEYCEQEVFLAGFPEVEAFGEGETESEAIANLKSDILDIYDELTECDPDELGSKPLSWLRILSKIITHNS